MHCVPKDRVTKFLLEKVEKKTKNFRHSTTLKPGNLSGKMSAFEKNFEKECLNRDSHSTAIINNSSRLWNCTSFSVSESSVQRKKIEKSTFALDGKIKSSIICYSNV